MNRIVHIISCILIMTIVSFANDQKRDSLLNELGHANPGEQIHILHKIHTITYQNNPEQSLEYAKRSVSIARKNNLGEFIARPLQDMGISYIVLNQPDSALHYFTKAFEAAKKVDDIRGKASSLRNMGTAWWYKSDLDKAIELYKKSTDMFEQLGDEQQLSTCISNLGTAYYAKGDFEKSIEYYKKAFELIDTIASPDEAGSFLNDIGTIYKEWGNRTKALEYYLHALRMNKKTKNKRHISANLHNIGELYVEDEEFEKALEYLYEAADLDKSINNTYGLPFSYLSIGEVFYKQSKYDTALDYYEKGLELFTEYKADAGKANALARIGKVYLKTNLFEKSLPYFSEAISIAREVDDAIILANAITGKAEAYLALNRNKEASMLFLQAETIAKKGNYVHLLKEIYQNLASTKEKLHQYELQSKYLNEYIRINDSVLSIEKQKQATELLAKYETEKKENQIKILNQEKELSRVKLVRQRAIIVAAVILLILGFLVAILFLKRYREKQRTNKLLSQKNKEIELKQVKIETQNRQLEKQANQLKELDELKSRFFANISHEFRTPLTLILGPVEQLILSEKNPSKHTSLQLVKQNAKKLLELINQLLEIARIEKGQIKLKLFKTDLNKSVSFITELFSSMAKEKGLDIWFESQIADAECYFDKEKIDKIVTNLLSNAIKNTDSGSINVHLNWEKENSLAKISIKDTGKGISNKDLPHVFDRFYTLGKKDSSGNAGIGIGLAFTKELVELHKGKIDIESEEGKGTTISIYLPVDLKTFKDDDYEILDQKTVEQYSDLDTLAENVEINQDDNQEQKNKHTILVVEDNDDLRSFIAGNLKLNYNVITSENGRKGIDKALEEIPDIIITDVMMPEVDGIQLTETLKSNENTSHIPIVILTAKASHESRIEGLKTEADDYLTKPFSIEELSLRIQNILKTRDRLHKKYQKSIVVNPTEITTNSTDEVFLTKMLESVEKNMENAEFNVEDLCNAVGMSRTTIHKKLKQLVDQSATEFINSIRMKRAAQLLRQKAGTISEIAYQVGFNNLSYFNRLFKKQFNITPTAMLGNKDFSAE